jgi:ABC-type glycerol-3-phosphate transport system substrate-binding protein
VNARRSVAAFAATAAAAAVVLTGCSGGGGDAPGGEVTLRWATYSQERLDFFQQAAAEFHKEYPNITVEPEAMAEDDYKQALPLSFRSKNSPDIFVYTFPTAGDYFELSDVLLNDWVQPLDASVLPADFASRFPGTNDLTEPVYSNGGNMYTIPRPPSTGAVGYGYMYYNEDLIAKAGLTDSIPATWEDFRAACAAIEAVGASCLAVPTQGPEEIDRLLTTFVSLAMTGYRPGGPSVATGELDQITEPDFVDAIEYLRSLFADKYVVPGSYDKVAARQAVATGQAAFYFDGGWMSTVFPESFDFTGFGVAVPPGKNGPGPEGYVGRIGQGPPLPETFISSQSAHPKEATQFLEWMTRPDGWYTQHFSEQGFDVLPWGDPQQIADWMPVDSPTRDLLLLSDEVHVIAPQPAFKCPDLAQSQALTNVDDIRSNWVYGAVDEYLLNGGDWLQIAQPIVDQQDQVFNETLASEAASGLDVSPECFAAPDWDGVTPFDNGAGN